jgi:hypothetical protein
MHLQTPQRGSILRDCLRFTSEANHGGGYSYRLAPANGPLTEETFGKIPLKFVGQQVRNCASTEVALIRPHLGLNRPPESAQNWPEVDFKFMTGPALEGWPRSQRL